MFIFKVNSTYHYVFQGDQLIHRQECHAAAKFLSVYFSSKESKGEFSLKNNISLFDQIIVFFIYNNNNINNVFIWWLIYTYIFTQFVWDNLFPWSLDRLERFRIELIIDYSHEYSFFFLLLNIYTIYNSL